MKKNFLGNIVITIAWNCFLAGLGFLALHYIVKLFYQKPQVKKIKSKLPKIGEFSKVIAVIPAYNEEKSVAEIIKKTKEQFDKYKKRGIKIVLCIVGVEGIKKVVAQLIRKDIHITDSIEEAKEWLVKQ